MATSRKDIRVALGADMKTDLEGTGKPAQAVYDYLPAVFKTSPVLCVVSSGTKTNRMGIGQTNKAKNIFRYELMIFQVTPTEVNGWNASDAQDAQDDLEKAVRDWVVTHQTSVNWKNLRFADNEGEFTEIVPVKLGGEEYELETIVVEVEAYDT